MKLLIAIPALNEEASIEKVIRRSIEARGWITTHPSIQAVDITIVCDGSTDKTADIARCYAHDVTVIEFAENRGYGAAILHAWKDSNAELLGCMDADGTCDPYFFADLVDLLLREKADIVLGNRLHRGSRMPFVRRFGNLIFSIVLSVFSSTIVKDTTSGMRIVRRSSLPQLMPLPSGLHFTPAMSARAIMRGDIVILEKDMPYHEREGESKLRLFQDGFRFLAIILDAVLLYRPSRLLSILGLGGIVSAGLLMLTPGFHYLSVRQVPDWMVYRFIVSYLLATSGLTALCGAYLARKIVSLTVLPSDGRWMYQLLDQFFLSLWFWLLPLVLGLGGAVLLARSFVEMVQFGATNEHWSRFITAAFFLAVAFTLIGVRVMVYSLDLIASWLQYARDAVQHKQTSGSRRS